MMYEELEQRLKKEKANLTRENYAALESAYIALDLEKDDFAKIVDSVGIEALVAKGSYFKMLLNGRAIVEARLKFIANENKIAQLLKTVERATAEIEELQTNNAIYKQRQQDQNGTLFNDMCVKDVDKF